MCMKKVVVFGGGTGMSYLLKGLKQYPLDITAVVSVCDDGGSTGILRDEFNMLAVGDIRKVLIALSKTEEDFGNLLNYRFTSDGTLNKHTVGNILLTAAANVTDGSNIEGEHFITKSPKKIKKVYYKNDPKISRELIKEIINADIIVLSMGSLFTSVIPTLLSKQIRDAIDDSNAKIVYSCNLFTQPGETDGFTVSKHVKVLNEYLGKRKVQYVIANSEMISGNLAHKYATEEQKDPVVLDKDEIKKVCNEAIIDDLVIVENNVFRHDYFKLGYLIFSLTFDHNYREDIKK